MQIKAVVPGDDGVISPPERNRFPSYRVVLAVRDKHLPPVRRASQLVEIERNEVIEEMAVDLATKDVEFRAQDIQSVAVATCGPRGRRGTARPLFSRCSCQIMGIAIWLGWHLHVFNR